MTIPAPARGWASWRLQRRLRALLVGAGVALVVFGLSLLFVLRQADHRVTVQTNRTFPARLAAAQLLTSLVNQETGLRGYALSGDPAMLQPYRQGLIDEQDARARLEGFVRRGDRARLALLTVDAAITAWRDQYASLHTGITPSATNTIGFGEELFDRVRQAHADLDAVLFQDVKDARAENAQNRRIVLTVLGLITVAVIGLVVALQRALSSSVIEPMHALAKQVDRVADGDYGAPIRASGPPDLREMAQRVEQMRVQLVRTLEDLTRSNADLEQFAYVASHDLQEPLRKVASFCQLLEKRYKGQLDERADQYIDFAVDGARRMQVLITDLLAFSRVGRTSEGFEPVDLTVAINKAWHELDSRVTAEQAKLEVDIDAEARCVNGDGRLLHMLVSNLLGNALKYRQADVAPIVRVSSHREGDMARVEVADNGIGIPEEYAAKVFVIFQRLHGRDEYEGTGIGLSLAKKIVEFHGGAIAVVPSPLGGACLSFTLPLVEVPAHE